jgi:hypothetical protein
MPVTFEASQKSRSASSLIGIVCPGLRSFRAWNCIGVRPSSPTASRKCVRCCIVTSTSDDQASRAVSELTLPIILEEKDI